MRHLVNHFTTSNPRMNKIILHCYLNAQTEEDLEKGCRGLFRALLYQLLQRSPPFPKNLLQAFKDKSHTRGSWTWQKTRNQELFFEALRRKNIKPVTIFIDALDECGLTEKRY